MDKFFIVFLLEDLVLEEILKPKYWHHTKFLLSLMGVGQINMNIRGKGHQF
jgi:hypothetical protein